MKKNKCLFGVALLISSACLFANGSAQGNEIKNVNEYVSIVAKGDLQNHSFYSDKLFVDSNSKDSWNYSIYLPSSYDPELEYPIIYFLHGAGGDFTNWPTKAYIVQKMDRLIATGDIAPSIAVFVDGFTSYYIDGDKHNLQSAFLEDFIPEIHKNFSITPNRKAHAIAGLSMGGFGASRFTLLDPEYFSQAIMLSPAVWTVESMPESRKKDFADNRSDVYGDPFDDRRLKAHQYDEIDLKNPTQWPVNFYVAYGSADEITSPADAKKFVNWAKEKGFGVEEKIYNGYGHSWDFWSMAIDDGLRMIGENF